MKHLLLTTIAAVFLVGGGESSNPQADDALSVAAISGKQQTGYFDPFGKPINEALAHAKAANEQAVQWHEKSGSLKNIYSNKRK